MGILSNPRFPPSPAELYARALWDPKPTKSLKTERQLAYALGYPSHWRVVRTVVRKDGKHVIRDTIHTRFGKTSKQQCNYTWFNHEAAQKAARELEKEGTMSGSHLLPALPLYTKGDVVEVFWEGKWYSASITKRKKQADSFFYSVVYHQDSATQDEVGEEDIRPGEDPSTLAVELGFTADWKASRKGSRYILTAPTGERFTTKKAAMVFFNEIGPQMAEEQDVGDPPWRIEGHEWIGRSVKWTSSHKISSRRTVDVEQEGRITGYIKKTDVDKEGSPGFISEATGEPADLFHVVFPEDKNHPYSSHLLTSQDLEEYEVLENLLEVEEEEPAKRKMEEIPTSSTKKKKRGRR
ncbi:unnamed protein product [Cylindrotheca closterium]|uniref:Agenet domain-containing protein n=1 Tax=Cylindrotheca closterium TaxID=2856 RepID=A0AAD2CBF9_9STRA|nr:unnamed protein product [Cylindrotheca closterium]